MKNILISVAVVALFGFGVYSAHADEACKIAPAAETLNRLESGGAKLQTLPQSQVDTLSAAKGNPPGADGKPYSITRVNMNDFSALLVIQGDCINDKIGPVPAQLIDNALGVVNG